MAERRMFAKTIVLSDVFLDMPMSARCLYFTLGMLADDDGFVNSPKSIMRQCGASEDDMKLLIAKKFVLDLIEENGVIVIKHWRVNNYLRSDRYIETKYVDAKDKITVDERGIYHSNHVGIPVGIPGGIPKTVSTGKDSIGEDSIVKYRVGEYREGEGMGEGKNQISCQLIADTFNRLCPSFPVVKVISEARKKAINARLKQYTIDDFETVFKKTEASSFLKGSNNKNWSANFDWVIKDANMAKILDGNYDDRGHGNNQTTRASRQAQELDDFYKMATAWAEGDSDGTNRTD